VLSDDWQCEDIEALAHIEIGNTNNIMNIIVLRQRFMSNLS